MSAVTHLINHRAYLRIGIAGAAIGGIALFVLPDPLVLFGLAALPFMFVAAYYLKDYPFELCLAFIIFSFFRIHEAFPLLMPFRIPQMLAIMTLASLAWHYYGTRLIRPFWSIELILFAWFFALCTVGMIFATDRPTAWAYWKESYIKIAIMMLATAWLSRTPQHFNSISKFIVLAGLAISYVTLSNKFNGIGLVEETRVTIGRDIGSNLGDPNDLSLVLLFPLSFACSLMLTFGVSRWQRVMGFLATPMILWAIVSTQSRGGLIGAAAVIGVFGRYKIKSNLLLISIAAIGVLGLFAAAGISGRVSGGAAEEGIDASSDGRLYAWGAAFRMALSRPLTGVGLDNFIANYWSYSNLHDGHNHAVHSTWFGVLAETGFIGILLFVSMIVLSMRSAIITSHLLSKTEAPPSAIALSQALVAGLTGSIIAGSFLTQGFTWPFYIQIALVVALTRYAQTADWRQKTGARPIATLPGAPLSAFRRAA